MLVDIIKSPNGSLENLASVPMAYALSGLVQVTRYISFIIV